MRLWTLHPRYLDSRGLVALWREGLLALNVLAGHTRGYRNHPQLVRFRACPDPLAAMRRYLEEVYNEASRRGYAFNHAKIEPVATPVLIRETQGQLLYEWAHLLAKLARRSPVMHEQFAALELPQAHPLFIIVPGGIRDWERAAGR